MRAIAGVAYISGGADEHNYFIIITLSTLSGDHEGGWHNQTTAVA
jgi:hypothetical protein